MHIAPIPLGLTILGAGLLIGPIQESYHWLFVRDPFWFLRDPDGWMRQWKSNVKGVIVRAAIGLISLVAGIIGLIIY